MSYSGYTFGGGVLPLCREYSVNIRNYEDKAENKL